MSEGSKNESVDYVRIEQALRCLAPAMDSLCKRDDASLTYEMLADAVAWTDEIPDSLTLTFEQVEAFGWFRLVLRFRTTLILGEPLETSRRYWEYARASFPNWPGFAPERCQPSSDVLQYYRRQLARASKNLERWDKLCGSREDDVDTAVE